MDNEFCQSVLALDKALKLYDPTNNGMDCNYAHGYLAATAISPVPCDAENVFTYLVEEEQTSDTSSREKLIHAISNEVKAVDRILNMEEEAVDIMPDDRESLAMWCTGFLDVHFQEQEQWLEENDQQVSELLFPFMLISGLFDDEPDFREMTRDEKLIEDMHDQLPEVLVELYLLFRE